MDTQTKEKIVEDYKNGLKLTDIFKKYHTSYQTVVKILDDKHIEHSRSARKKSVPNLKNRRNLTPEEEKKICEIYKKTGRVADCCLELRAGQDVIRRCLKKYNLYRTSTEATRMAPQNQRKYSVKDNYFDKENPRMAYLLGLLAADGCVRKNTNELKLSFSSIDRDFLVAL